MTGTKPLSVLRILKPVSAGDRDIYQYYLMDFINSLQSTKNNQKHQIQQNSYTNHQRDPKDPSHFPYDKLPNFDGRYYNPDKVSFMDVYARSVKILGKRDPEFQPSSNPEDPVAKFSYQGVLNAVEEARAITPEQPRDYSISMYDRQFLYQQVSVL